MIATDVNNSGSITVLDVIAIRKVILRIENSFPNNSPWRFVPESFDFPNPKNPWETPFPEEITESNSINGSVTFKITNGDGALHLEKGLLNLFFYKRNRCAAPFLSRIRCSAPIPFVEKSKFKIEKVQRTVTVCKFSIIQKLPNECL